MSALQQPAPTARVPFYQHLYFQVIAGILLGVAVGQLSPERAASLKPLGDAFVKLVKMMIAPVIFTTVVAGIAKVGDMREVGRVGLKALLYFEAISTLALVIGLVVAHLVQPGAGIHADPAKLDAKAVATYAQGAKSLSTVEFLLHVIPDSLVGAFTGGEILQVLFVAVLFAFALVKLGEKGAPILSAIERITQTLFGMIAIIMRFAPIAAFGAMAYTVGHFGLGSLVSLGKLMACVYATCLLFVFVVLGTVARLAGFSLLKFLRYISEELLIVLGTSSSEAALPRMIAKLEQLGCEQSVVGLVIPTGYSFNLDGTSIYLTMAALFVAQATDTHLTLAQQLSMLGILLLTSKGAAAVTGGGFITLAATLATTGTVPVESLALLVGIDRFMSEARALTNLVGNGVATVVIARWENALDTDRLQNVLNAKVGPVRDEPQAVDEP